MKLLRELLHALIQRMLTVIFGDGIHEEYENKELRVDRNEFFTTLYRV